MKVILYINTGDKDEAIVGLLTDKKKITKRAKRKLSSQVVLTLIDKILKENKIILAQITDIKVYEGPGSYTGLRVGIAVANALARALNIKINGKKEIVDARYK